MLDEDYLLRLLLVFEDKEKARGLGRSFRQLGHAVDCLHRLSEVAEVVRGNPFSAVVMHLSENFGVGMSALTELRQHGSITPVIAISSGVSGDLCITALDNGADDFLEEPIHFGELDARLRAVIRRSIGRSAYTVRHPRIRMDACTARVWLDDQPVKLRRREFLLLCEFLNSGGAVLSRESLEDKIYSWDQQLASNAIEVHIHHLRQKLYPELIHTVRGLGYQLQCDAAR